MNQAMPDSGSFAKGGLSIVAKCVIILLVFLAALLSSYAAFCAWLGTRVPRGVIVEIHPHGEVLNLSGLSLDDAENLLLQSIRIDNIPSLEVVCGDQRVLIDSGVLSPDPQSMVVTLDQIAQLYPSVPFLYRGLFFLTGKGTMNTNFKLLCSYRYVDENAELEVDQTLMELNRSVSVAPINTIHTLNEDGFVVTTGTPGSALDTKAAKQAILSAFSSGQTSLALTPVSVEPPSPTAQELNELIYVAPLPIGLDQNGNTLPPVVGISIDVAAAQAALDAAAPGQSVSIPLVRTQPDYTEAGENGLLYQDLLSECLTYISGTSSRLSNVKLAAEKCNGMILFPGDVFSFNKVVGERTTGAGFKSAPAYYMGMTVNETGGGICQVSSSLYSCAVYANLEIVTRHNHRYAVGYIPDGLDATVSWGGPEFEFKNSTAYPIKILAFTDGRNLTVQFYGTNPDGIYVETERNRLSTINYTTVYQPDPSIPQGTTQKEVTPYTGRKVVVYRCVYAADGSLISRNLENTSNYSHRDEVILYNPADAVSLGLAPTQPSAPSESPPDQSTLPDASPPLTEGISPETSQPPAESTSSAMESFIQLEDIPTNLTGEYTEDV